MSNFDYDKGTPRTFHQKLGQMLFQHVVWPEEIEAIMEAHKKHPMAASMQGRWDSDIEGYGPAGPALVMALWLGVRKSALEYLDEKNPKHIAIQLLDPDMAIRRTAWDRLEAPGM